MKSYLFDTNICIYYINGKFHLKDKIKSIPKENRYISEITLAELKFGAKNSDYPLKNMKNLEDFLTGFQILPIFNSLDKYADEKTRLRKSGLTVDEFDLLIGCSAVMNNLIMVTNNESHLGRIEGITLENWIE
ncbi:MAG: type II toxin-antitoxin system VapC family toxin [Bacteroidales bacterium]|nr:type II toxin-antitoxin system VapC family toxin [Bacteroidales bacterium]MCF8336569.1 type II toxin-antitoxin system VapC family toxin [Bacteroidales bacterium]